jgi:hypothetical protein
LGGDRCPPRGNLTASARAGLRHSFLEGLSDFCAAALYKRFGKRRSAGLAQSRPMQARRNQTARRRSTIGLSPAARSGCTNIPLAAGRAQEDDLVIGCSSHGDRRFVHLDPPRLIGSR